MCDFQQHQGAWSRLCICDYNVKYAHYQNMSSPMPKGVLFATFQACQYLKTNSLQNRSFLQDVIQKCLQFTSVPTFITLASFIQLAIFWCYFSHNFPDTFSTELVVYTSHHWFLWSTLLLVFVVNFISCQSYYLISGFVSFCQIMNKCCKIGVTISSQLWELYKQGQPRPYIGDPNDYRVLWPIKSPLPAPQKPQLPWQTSLLNFRHFGRLTLRCGSPKWRHTSLHGA